ncbi:MAG: 5-(carboxyamino)imidazole ribonucleotide synthase [Rhizobium sp.]|jgi:5-(carboxyamino)imidazole ribonucleotide synthase|uniref:5-(carboxyamino)imidazole ribonucleotide synthase n=1 Tax=Thiobacillus sp. TaxID=924 RepID=UPI0025E42E38|nr:5-(carboxyamino)imidazole ribonucleotide synthase [Thiobacillus sp.]MBW8366206.1 5-(carboxyamino)imidazole ribonucleotide synthase [Rhizobium sp.]
MSSKPLPILPGATLGILGGGQLGRMFTIAARTMGYRVMVLDPDAASPAGQMADVHLQADYADHEALKQLGKACAAVTTEFENVPAASLIELANHCRVSPGADAVAIVQDRSHEKSWLAQNGFATAPFALVYSEGDLDAGMADVGAPALLKVARFGYDGKGQARVNTREEARAAFREFDGQPCVLEGFVKLEREVSVVLARSDAGECALFPVAENRHENGILDVSIVPARVPESLAHQACEMARDVADKLGYVGVMAVEFFVADGRLMVNEIAPRPHNSGHYTLDACVTDQFEQQVRALCGLPLGDTRLLSPVAMINILGDRWQDGGPHWNTLLSHPNIKLHLYGKQTARPGRKMGHFNVLDADADAALKLAEQMRDAL